jgi:tRNA A-37 threonylcarbamoyl transferase component Bud32
MRDAKDTLYARVHISWDGSVHKTFRGPLRKDRFENEVRVLQYLEEKGCGFVPKLLDQNPEKLKIVTTNVGQIVERMSREKCAKLFKELEGYGVRHDDAEIRNITYNQKTGRFCIIDFEFATILEPGYPPSPVITSHPNLDTFQEAE